MVNAIKVPAGRIQASPDMALDKKLTRDILAAVDAGFAAQTAFTEDLVRFPSLRGQEHTAQDFLFGELKQRGYAMDRWSIDVADIENHPGFSPVKVEYTNAINVVDNATTGDVRIYNNLVYNWSDQNRTSPSPAFG
ncbi:MAG: hypothetical protein AAFW74_10390, partial [Pseudomonadota bacterium]